MNPGYIATAGWVSSALSTAATLGVADLLAAKPLSIQELAAATSTTELPLKYALRLLSQVGIFSEGADGKFTNTPDSEILRSDHPNSMRYFSQLAAGDYQRIFLETLQVVKTGEPASRRVLGEPLYEYLDHTPAAAEIYDRAMEDLARPVAAAFAARRNLSQVRVVADIGGGRGTLVKALLKAHSHLRGMVVDRASVCTRAREDLLASDPALAARLDYRPGDFFSEVPAADLYLLKNVLHNFGDASCVALLSTIKAAMSATADARLIVIEPNETPALHRALDDLLRLVICEKGADWRSIGDLERLANRARLSLVGQVAKGFAFLEFKVSS